MTVLPEKSRLFGVGSVDDIKQKKRCWVVRHSDEPGLNRLFSPILHKKFPKCVSIPGIFYFSLQ